MSNELEVRAGPHGGHGATVLWDGEEIKNLSAITVRVAVSEPNKVLMEFPGPIVSIRTDETEVGLVYHARVVATLDGGSGYLEGLEAEGTSVIGAMRALTTAVEDKFVEHETERRVDEMAASQRSPTEQFLEEIAP